jgi:hypothetical protein
MPILKHCGKPGCRTLVPQGTPHCPQHARAETARRNAKRKAFGYGRAHWKRVRAARHLLAGGVCELRINCAGAPSTHTHLAPALRGRHDLATVADCRACCASCSGAIDAPRAHHKRKDLYSPED